MGLFTILAQSGYELVDKCFGLPSFEDMAVKCICEALGKMAPVARGNACSYTLLACLTLLPSP